MASRFFGLASFSLALAAMATHASAAQPEARAFEHLLNAGRLALKKKDYDQAAKLCREALAASQEPWHGGPRSVRSAALCAEVEQDRGALRAAARRFREAAQLAADEPRDRRRLLIARRHASEEAGAERQVAQVTDLLEHDSVVQSILDHPQRGGMSLDRQLALLAAAKEAYGRDRDRAFELLADAARALLLARSGRTDEGLALAQELVRGDLPRMARLAALEAKSHAHLTRRELKPAAEAAIDLNALRHGELAPNARRFARVPELDQACAAYDAKAGAGACSKLEMRRTGFVTFTDWSQQPRRPELGAKELEQVHGQALVALEACVVERVRSVAAKLRGTRVEVKWLVDKDGRTLEAQVTPSRLSPQLDPCLREVVARLRYPKSEQARRTPVTVPLIFE